MLPLLSLSNLEKNSQFPNAGLGMKLPGSKTRDYRLCNNGVAFEWGRRFVFKTFKLPEAQSE